VEERTKISIYTFLEKFEIPDKEVIEDFGKHLSRVELPRKTLLLKAGKVCDHLYFMEKGLARNFCKEGDKDITNDIYIDSDLLTSLSSFISRKPSWDNIELLEDSLLYSIHYDDLQLMYRKHPVLERIGRMITESYYISLSAQTYRLKFSSSSERYEALYNRKTEIIRRAPIGMIASYLGMTIETLSRIRGKEG